MNEVQQVPHKFSPDAEEMLLPWTRWLPETTWSASALC